MIPQFECVLDHDLPDRELWLPTREDLEGDEGFGFYRDTRVIAGVSIRLATQYLEQERDLVACVDASARTPDEFDTISRALEHADPDYLSEEGIEVVAGSCLDGHLTDDVSPTNGLDLGVGGLVYVLGAVGCFPMASCRSHGPGSWSEHPVVCFTARLWRAQLLAPLATQAGCGLVTDSQGSLMITAPSIVETMELAAAVLDVRSQFRKNPNGPRRRSPRKRTSQQLSLDI